MSGTSKKTELKLVGVARSSLEELLLDYEDFLRQRGWALWDKNHPQALEVRALEKKDRADRSDQTDHGYSLYRSLVEREPPETAANTIICLIHQANYLLDQQLRALEKEFMEEGGFTERLYRVRREARKSRSDRSVRSD